MNTVEIKSEIVKVLDTMPEETLASVLSYLRSVIISENKIILSSNLRKILEEDNELLQKLAR
jgi:hypothetical protein